MARWIYVVNSSGTTEPAAEPADFYADDPLSVEFENGWGNVAGEQAVSYRLFPSTKLQICLAKPSPA